MAGGTVRDMSLAATLVSGVAIVAGLLPAWPQLIRIVLRGDARGVSALTSLLAPASGLVWNAVGLLEDVTALLVFNTLYGLGAGPGSQRPARRLRPASSQFSRSRSRYLPAVRPGRTPRAKARMLPGPAL